MMSILVAALLVVAARAECNNGCSGHGMCTNYKMMFSETTPQVQENRVPNLITDATTGIDYTPADGATEYGFNTNHHKKDSCTCFTKMEEGVEVYAYTGADCSLLTCPYGASWDSPPNANDDHNDLVECSNRGVCDRKTGRCECFEGYEGKGCRRTTCPNNCNQHGTCKTIHEIAKLMSENTDWDSLSEFEYTSIRYSAAWDAHKIRGCLCDAGWRAADCSEPEPPSGPDPMGGPGAESGRECSGRGWNLDGACVCYKGFFGAECGSQRANVM